MDFFSKIFRIDKNECLCHFTSFKNLFDEFKFFSMLTFQNKLFHVRKLQLFSLHSNLLGFIQDFYHSLLNLLIFSLILILWICCWEENPLKINVFFDMLVIFDLLDTIKISIIMKEKVRFINHHAFQRGKINWLPAIYKTLNLSMSSYYNLLRLVFSIEIRYSDPSTFD
jgi:hypothetical protein